MKNNTAIILIVLAIALFYAFTNVQYGEVRKLNALADQYSSVLKNASEIIQLRDSLLVDYGALPKNEVDRLNKILPNNVDTVQLALDLDSMAGKYGISIKNIQTSTENANNPNAIVVSDNSVSQQKATVTFNFVASYDNFMKFLADIEQSLRIMDVRSIQFLSNETGLYDFQVKAETYWLK